MAFVNYGPAPLSYTDQQGRVHPTNAGIRRWDDFQALVRRPA